MTGDQQARSGGRARTPWWIVSCLLLAASAAAVEAAAPFGPQAIVDDGASDANVVLAADLDADGDLDLVVGTRAGVVAWYPNQGGVFGAASPITSLVTVVVALAVGDLDGDGDPDVVSVSMSNDEIAWYANDGGGGFGAQQLVTTGSEADAPRSVAVADLDGDGDPDLVECSRMDDEVAWYENLGGGAFGAQSVVTNLADRCVQVLAVDVERDGDLDLLSVSESDGKVSWYANDGDGGFGAQRSVASLISPFAIAAADFDRDGWIDVVAGTRSGSVQWMRSDGMAGFEAPRPIEAPERLDVFFLLAPDLDRDGDADVVVADPDRDALVWHENDGAGGFGDEQGISALADTNRSIAAGDLDGDGDVDLASASLGDDEVAWYPNVSLHRSAAFPVRESLSPATVAATRVALADLDADGDLDGLLASSDSDAVSVVENDGTGGFAAPAAVAIEVSAPSDLAAGDVDGDGHADLVAASPGDGRIALSINDGSGVLTPAADVSSAATGVSDVSLVDLDRDGDLDVLSVLATTGAVVWLENLGSGFATGVTLSGSPAGAFASEAADLDGDGDVDVVAASAFGGALTLFEAVGDASFASGESLGALVDAAALAIGDVDRDGRMDLVVATSTGVAWLRNLGALAFSAAMPIDDVALASLQFGDLDHDGDLDLVGVTTGDVGDLVVLASRGDGSFDAAVPVAASDSSAHAVVLADLDRDGDLDILSAAAPPQAAASFLNRGGQLALAASREPDVTGPGRAALFALDGAHRGWPGEPSAELGAIPIDFASDGAPSDAKSIQAFVERIALWADDGSGSFEPEQDVEIVADDGLALEAGRLTLQLLAATAGSELAPGQTRRWFVVADLSAWPEVEVQVSLPLAHAQAFDVSTRSALTLETTGEASDAVRLPEPAPALAGGAVVLVLALRRRRIARR